MIDWFSRALDRFATVLTAGVILLTIVLGLGLSRIQIARTIDDSTLPSTNELVRSMREVRQAFGESTKQIVIAVEAADSSKVTAPENIRLIGAISRALTTVPTIKRETILSLTSVKDFRAEGLDILTDPVVPGVPSGPAESLALDRVIEANPFVYGRIVSKDLRTALVVASVHVNVDLTLIHDQVFEAIAGVRSSVAGTRVTVVGDPEINYQLQSSIEKDVAVFIAIALALMLVTFYLLFRSWHGVVYPFGAILVAIVWTMGLVGYYGEPITLLSATLPVVLIVIGGSCAIHVYFNLVKRDGARPRAELFADVFRHLSSPLLMATLTTFVGGVTLLTFRIGPIRHFGAFTALGTLISTLAAVILIPSLYRLFPPKATSRPRDPEEGAASAPGFFRAALRRFAAIPARHPWPVLLSVPLILVVSGMFAARVEIGFDNLSALPRGNPIREVAQKLEDVFEGTRTFEIMIDAGEANGMLDSEMLSRIDRFESEALKLPEVSRGFSVVHLIRKVHSVLAPESGSALPESRDAVAQYLLLLGMSETGMPLSTLVSADYRKARVLLTLDTNDTKRSEAVYERLKRLADEVFSTGSTGSSASTGAARGAAVTYGGQFVFWIALMRYLVWGKIQNMLLTMLIILVIVMARYRSIARGLITVIPLPLGVITNFGLMGALGIRLDFVTAIITSFAMGIGVDFSIHFMAALRREYRRLGDPERAIVSAITGPGRAILYNALCCVAGFSVLLLSRFSAINTFAVLICFNMAVLLGATFLVVPALVRVAPPAFVTGAPRLRSETRRKALFATKVAFSAVLIAILCAGIVVSDARSSTPAAQAGKELTASEILRKSVQAIHNHHEESLYVMTLKGMDGQESVRKMKVWFKSAKDDDFRLMIKFTEPANIAGTGFLSVISGGGANQWLYLPALRRARRISGGSSSESFLGSDFTMADISVDRKGHMDFSVTGSTKCGEGECHVLTGVPEQGKEGDAPYLKQIMHVRKDSFLNVYTEFHNHAGKLEKVMTLEGIHKDPSGKWMARRMKMENLLTKHSTTIEFENRNVKTVPPDSIFTKHFLERR